MYLNNNIANSKMNMQAFSVGVYCRLSKDDEQIGESASISNQRDIILNYCAIEGLEVFNVYADDGYTGLNMNRPDLQRLLQDIEDGKVNMVITKDMSRLGRNRIEVGQLLDTYFPKHNVRYLALNDGIDTFFEDSDIAPIKGLFNEMYSKDISKKVHSSYYLKAIQGKFTGNVPPFGYLKSPENHNYLIVDEDTAPIVKNIFYLGHLGYGSKHIVTWLENNKIECPSWWGRKKGYRNQYSKYELKDPENGKYVWDQSVVKGILTNPVYYGAIASQKTNYKFKVGVINKKPIDEWIIVENVHEPIISKEMWEEVQQKHHERRTYYKNDNPKTLFAGLLRCKDCGSALCVRYSHTTKEEKTKYYACKRYSSKGVAYCTQHRIDYDLLYEIVLNKIQKCAREALLNKSKILDGIITKSDDNSIISEIRKNIAKDEERLNFLKKVSLKMYEDYVAERIGKENFNSLISQNEKEQSEIKKRLLKNKNTIENCDQLANSTSIWLEEISKFTDMKSLDYEMLHHIVNKIEVSEVIDNDGIHHIGLTIYFNMREYPDPEICIDYEPHRGLETIKRVV